MNKSIKNKVLFGLSILFGLMFINAGLNKIFEYFPMPENLPEKMKLLMVAMNDFVWLKPLVAITQIFGGILIIIPKTRALGALVILPIMVGILLTNIIQDTSGLPLVIILFSILFWIMYQNREKYLQILR